jgi:phosphoribosylformylglycinamidine cyclo-ligase
MGKLSYKDAGVDTKEGEQAVSLMKEHVKKTFGPQVLTGLGGFGSLYRLDTKDIEDPVLVAGADGVGTKLKLAFMTDRHDTIGQDCVAMCVNDILCQGARPLFFLDYIATGRVRAERIAEIVKGIADGCLIAGCALVGGETAEMPGFYADGEYDVAGFAVGIADRSQIIDGRDIRAGDALVGLSSSGVHSNGFSLIRKIFFEQMGLAADSFVPELGLPIGEALLSPTRIYAPSCRAVLPRVRIKGMVHVTGGGFFENIPRVLPAGLGADIQRGAWEMPAIFPYIRACGDIEEREMFSAFNMGIGLILIVSASDAARAAELFREAGERAFVIGEVVRGEGVRLC